jgi:cytochrome oxidase Cu insertion factor (SCO1/SenC/PrrC family)
MGLRSTIPPKGGTTNWRHEGSSGKLKLLISMLSATVISLFFDAFSLSAGASAARQPAQALEPSVNQQDERHHHHPAPAGKAPKEESAVKMSIPDLPLLNQDGKQIHFYRDLIKGKVVAINFIFTTCTTICPPMAATFSKIQNQLGDRLGKDVYLISISVDPAVDTPQRLKAWGAKFDAKPGWTFVTGNKPEMDQLLKSLSGYSARKEDHSPTILIGDDAKGMWTRANGLAKPALLVQLIEAVMNGREAESQAKEAKSNPSQENAAQENAAARKYFSDVVLLNQNGEEMRFYSDLLKGKVVVINSFFTSCSSVCPLMNSSMEKIQAAFAERVGKDIFLISISVDPTTDTPPRLKEYAERFHAKPGWYFLTGKKENVDQALYKIGQYVEAKDDHSTIIIIGNERTGLWKKTLGLAKAEDLIKLVKEVVDDGT